MEFSIGWKTTRDIQLFGKNHSITVKIQVNDAEAGLSPAQEEACREYIEHEEENLKCMEQLMLKFSKDAASRFSPRRLLFNYFGGCALLCDDESDLDEGIVVCILPEKRVEYQSDYL